MQASARYTVRTGGAGNDGNTAFFVGDQGSLPVIMADRQVPVATLILDGEAVTLRDRLKR